MMDSKKRESPAKLQNQMDTLGSSPEKNHHKGGDTTDSKMVVMQEEYEVSATKRRRLRRIADEDSDNQEIAKQSLKRARPETNNTLIEDEEIAPANKKRKMRVEEDEVVQEGKEIGRGSHVNPIRDTSPEKKSKLS